MSVPLFQQAKDRGLPRAQKLRGRERYPLVLMLEPLFQCNLACAGCGKIDYPDAILRQRLSVEECLSAVDECGAPMVAIPGGEPLIHREIDQIVDGIVARGKFVSLCTNAILLEKNLHRFTPSKYLAFSVHLDCLREHHDRSVCRDGVFDKAISAISAAQRQGFQTNVNCTVFDGHPVEDLAEFLDECTALGVCVSISPGFAYERAPDQASSCAGRTPRRSSASCSPATPGAGGTCRTRRSTSTSSQATGTTSARPGGCRRSATSSAGSGRATSSARAMRPPSAS